MTVKCDCVAEFELPGSDRAENAHKLLDRHAQRPDSLDLHIITADCISTCDSIGPIRRLCGH